MELSLPDLKDGVSRSKAFDELRPIKVFDFNGNKDLELEFRRDVDQLTNL